MVNLYNRLLGPNTRTWVWNSTFFYLASFFLILGLSFTVRVYNLNYNAPFNDEAIYVVIGRLGVFHGDWETYDANSWMAGNSKLYPVMSALAYTIGGIQSSRFLSVLLGVLCVELVFRITALLSETDDGRHYLAGLIAATLLGFSSISIYLSRLATYDIPSFYFLLLGLYFFLSSHQPQISSGRDNFYSVIFLVLSFATKIINLIFVPLIIVYLTVRAKWLNDHNLFYGMRYFLVPLTLVTVVYSVFNWESFIAFANSQYRPENVNSNQILALYFSKTYFLWIFWGVSSLGLILSKRWKQWLVLTTASLTILVVHLVTSRLQTFEKHIFLSVIFLSICIGLGLSELTTNLIKFTPSLYKPTVLGVLAFPLFLYAYLSYQEAQEYNQAWDNGSKMLAELQQVVQPGDKLLTEYGASSQLAIYETNSPLNTSTFDYFNYNGKTGLSAYGMAVSDAYFDFIELNEENTKGGNEEFKKIHQIVTENIQENYEVVYSEDGFSIYKRSL